MDSVDLYKNCMKDGELVQEQAFTELSKNLYRVALRIFDKYNKGHIGPEEKELARDMVQETLIKIWQNRRSVRDKSRFLAWSYTVLANIIRDKAPFKNRFLTFSYLLSSSDAQQIEEILNSDQLDKEDVDKFLNAFSLPQVVEKIWNSKKSSPLSKNVIFKLYIEEMSESECAAHMGMSANHVYTEKSRDLKRLRDDPDLQELAMNFFD